MVAIKKEGSATEQLECLALILGRGSATTIDSFFV